MEQLCAIVIGEDLREQQVHGSYAFPLQVYLDDMDKYHESRVPWHWHDEIEFGVMLTGRVEVSATGESCTLAAGDGFFINSNVLHAMHSATPGAKFFSVVLSPRILAGHLGSVLEQKYVKPLLASQSLKMLALRGTEPWQAHVLDGLRRVRGLCAAEESGYELAVTAALCTLWQQLYNAAKESLATPGDTLAGKDDGRIKQLMDFIHGNYGDSISLEQIAASASISVSECCRCFKRALHTTPFGYLNQYRLVVAAELLRSGFSATTVFREAGYCSQSYFGKQFKQTYGCTPGQYRRQHMARAG